MNYRIEISPLPAMRDARAAGVRSAVASQFGIKLDNLLTRDVYTVSSPRITGAQARAIAASVCNPVLHGFRVNGAASENFVALPEPQALIAVGFKPGVTDNVGRTLAAAASDVLGRKVEPDEYFFSSTEYLLYGNIDREGASRIGKKLLALKADHSQTAAHLVDDIDSGPLSTSDSRNGNHCSQGCRSLSV